MYRLYIFEQYLLLNSWCLIPLLNFSHFSALSLQLLTVCEPRNVLKSKYEFIPRLRDEHGQNDFNKFVVLGHYFLQTSSSW